MVRDSASVYDLVLVLAIVRHLMRLLGLKVRGRTRLND